MRTGTLLINRGGGGGSEGRTKLTGLIREIWKVGSVLIECGRQRGTAAESIIFEIVQKIWGLVLDTPLKQVSPVGELDLLAHLIARS